MSGTGKMTVVGAALAQIAEAMDCDCDGRTAAARPCLNCRTLALVQTALAEREERIAALEDALSLPLMFHAGGPWDAVKREEWIRIAGTDEATPRTLCDAVRRVLGMPRAPREEAPDGA